MTDHQEHSHPPPSVRPDAFPVVVASSSGSEELATTTWARASAGATLYHGPIARPGSFLPIGADTKRARPDDMQDEEASAKRGKQAGSSSSTAGDQFHSPREAAKHCWFDARSDAGEGDCSMPSQARDVDRALVGGAVLPVPPALVQMPDKKVLYVFRGRLGGSFSDEVEHQPTGSFAGGLPATVRKLFFGYGAGIGGDPDPTGVGGVFGCELTIWGVAKGDWVLEEAGMISEEARARQQVEGRLSIHRNVAGMWCRCRYGKWWLGQGVIEYIGGRRVVSPPIVSLRMTDKQKHAWLAMKTEAWVFLRLACRCVSYSGGGVEI